MLKADNGPTGIASTRESMHMSTLTFLGAVGEVTGSRYLLEAVSYTHLTLPTNREV